MPRKLDNSKVQQPKETMTYKLHGLVLANPQGISKIQISEALYNDDSYRSMKNTDRVIREYRVAIRASQGLNYYYNSMTRKYHVCRLASEVEKVILQLMSMDNGLKKSMESLLHDYNELVPVEQRMSMEQFRDVVGG